MKKGFKKFMAVTAAIAISLSVAACGNGGSEGKASRTNKLTYWVRLQSGAAQTVSNFGDTQLAQKLMDKFDVDIEYQHPATGQESEKFNVMLAMGNLPDIVEYNWDGGYPGGVTKALDDGIIQEINLEKDAPNLAAYVKEHPEIDKMIKTDDGRYYGFPFIRGDEYLQTSGGPIVRKDWLDELGLDEPETIDDWTTMLRAFKEKKGAKAPLTTNIDTIGTHSFIVGAFGIDDAFYLDNGKVKYGPVEDGYKDYLTLMRAWYAEGLLDANFASVDGATVEKNMLNGISGATFGGAGGGIGKWLGAALEEKFDLLGAKNPVLNKGERAQFGAYDLPVVRTCVAVITKDADKELAAKLLDYGYSEEGQMLYNFGVEGDSYEMKDGYPTYTEKITNDPDGLSMMASMARYTLSYAGGPFIQKKEYMEQYAALPQQQEALLNWKDTDMKNHELPPISLTVEQQNEIATIRENLDTYRREMVAKFIMGSESIDKFDEFRNVLYSRGLDKYLQYMQEAYDRYQSR